ncbi:hypothetical protein [Granulicatella seriolae]|uniref:Uncharacterized protein n=1 Tax=Granulicatella seriolae TaxID=2967226 RepID=A0ABT1WQP7_9LACT|nr:hypothetical protein [Granulicatella seriolae]
MKEERKIKDFDDIGLHILSMPDDEPNYYYKGVSEYARAKGVEMVDLTDEELEQFRVN